MLETVLMSPGIEPAAAVHLNKKKLNKDVGIMNICEQDEQL